ncbi:MAG: M28 family peptidase, partial [Candidatus Hadarchaeota archaeon]|nr:M28 family peptidase [Candidatus Hadarchaeota archaeon]
MIEKNIEISEMRLQKSVSDLCDIGVKYAGTPGEVKARDYLLGKLTDFGLEDVHLEEFEYLNYMPDRGELEIISPESRMVVCEPLQHSANEEVEGELVYAGASKEEFEKLLARGMNFKERIALTKTPFPFFLYPLAEKYGAAGVVVITDPPDDLIRAATGVNDRREGGIPGVTISEREGKRLLDLLKGGKVRVRVGSQGMYSKKESSNLIGKISGDERPGEKVVVCSHYDSQIKGQHAWDNVSGDAGLLEIARSMVDLHPKRTVEIVFFGVEEQGPFWGSTSYVKAHEEDLRENCRALINLDGFSSSLCPKNFLETTPEARDYALGIAKEQNWSVHHVGDP